MKGRVKLVDDHILSCIFRATQSCKICQGYNVQNLKHYENCEPKMCWDSQNNKTSIWLWEGGLGIGSWIGWERQNTKVFWETTNQSIETKGSGLLIIFKKNVYMYLKRGKKFNPRVREIMNIMNIPWSGGYSSNLWENPLPGNLHHNISRLVIPLLSFLHL